MELLVTGDRKKVFTFNESLGDKVWEAEPVTRFRFKSPPENEWVLERLKSNYPTCGVFYDGKHYIGSSDGFIYTPDKKIQRVPEISVDTALFLDEYKFANDSERKLFERFKREGVKVLTKIDRKLAERIFDIDNTLREVSMQDRNIDHYLDDRFPRIRILGFAINIERDGAVENLYDGCLTGIHETISGRRINDLPPQGFVQINKSFAGFVPSGYPPVPFVRFDIEKGIEVRTEVHCVDYRSLWTLDGKRMLVQNICPRDGSGYRSARFATDINTTAISHGDFPCEVLDILSSRAGYPNKKTTIRLNPDNIPKHLLIRDGQVFGYVDDSVVNYSTGEGVFSSEGNLPIRSISDSGLCTTQNEGRTEIYDPFKSSNRRLDSMPGEYYFLQRAPQ